MSAAPPDVEQQRTALATDKPAGSSSNDVPRLTDTWQRKSLADRYLPANRVVRYLCLGTVLAVIVFLITFLVLWFTAKPLYFVLMIEPPTTWRSDERPIQWSREGTIVQTDDLRVPQSWDCRLLADNENAFNVHIEDLTITAKFTARPGHDVQFGTTKNAYSDPQLLTVPAKQSFTTKTGMQVRWDLADHDQAMALASLLVLCGVNATSLPAPLNNSAEPPANVTAPDAGFVQWYLEARRVTGLFGLDMTPPPGRLAYWQDVRGNRAAWGGAQPHTASDSIMEVVCPEYLPVPHDYVPSHIFQLANLTRTVCDETGKCR
ncbi:hypothetical protein AMAG_16512 [Allomyces macrogynus ATCC 38327]|uniref:Uncharacterized protein n=1 Tax=Allomyces macrogynus (strain ATCC 38327) TaxID=578462 RepID=A0A0L0TD75_ALLM3|nr:hypothetical protein AMAG_16512 [Allomyces macrogynus ATCC 38327]|eukprot:KNE72469.1 hypothetical protein AMAG_16512 [Allomyces macrogynus ATCC 38327]